MGLFGKKKRSIEEYIEQEGDLFEPELETMISFNRYEEGDSNTFWEERSGNVKAPHSLTAEELIGDLQSSRQQIAKSPDNIEMQQDATYSPAARSLYDRMIKNNVKTEDTIKIVKQQSSMQDIKQHMKEELVKDARVEGNDGINQQSTNVDQNATRQSLPVVGHSHTQNASNIISENTLFAAKDFSDTSLESMKAAKGFKAININANVAEEFKNNSATKDYELSDSFNNKVDETAFDTNGVMKSQVGSASVAEYPKKSANAEKTKESLISKCKSYVTDDEGISAAAKLQKPAYTLQSVEDIIGDAEKRAKERIARIYGEDLAKNTDSELNTKDGLADSIVDVQKLNNSKRRKPPMMRTSIETGVNTQFEKDKAPVKISIINMCGDERVLVKNDDCVTLPTNSGDVLSTKISGNQSIIKTMKFSLADEVVNNLVSQKTKEINISETDKIAFTDYNNGESGIPNVSPSHSLYKNPEVIKKSLLSEGSDEWEEEFEGRRKKFAKSFKLFGDKEEELLQEELPPNPKIQNSITAVEMDDYSCIDDAPYIKSDLITRKHKLITRIVPTAFITITEILLALPICDAFKIEYPMPSAIISSALLFLMVLFNISIIKGLFCAFLGKPDMDTPIAIVVSAVMINSIVAIFMPGSSIPLEAIAGLALLAGNIGKLMMVSRVKKGFNVVATNSVKRMIKLVDNQKVTTTMADGAIDGDVLVCGDCRAVNVSGYLKNCFSKDPYERLVPKIVIASLIIALISAAIAGIALSNIAIAVSVFAMVLCISCPPSLLLLSNLPLKLMADHLANYDAAVLGYGSAEQISMANAVHLDAFDLFPEGTITLQKMFLLSKNPVDKVLLEAASLAITAKSPISHVFKNIVGCGDQGDSLFTVEDITYEDRMGLSGWIGDRRVLIGNRVLLEGHGISVPSADVDKKILKRGCFPVYIATDGKPCVLLVVEYSANDDITYEIRRLCDTGTTLLISSNDPYVSETMLCDYFGLIEESVKIMNKNAVRAYKSVTNYSESTKAPGVFNANICGMLAANSASIRLPSVIRIMTVIQIIGIFAGMIGLVSSITIGNISSIWSLIIIAYQVLCAAIVCIVPIVKRP